MLRVVTYQWFGGFEIRLAVESRGKKAVFAADTGAIEGDTSIAAFWFVDGDKSLMMNEKYRRIMTVFVKSKLGEEVRLDDQPVPFFDSIHTMLKAQKDKLNENAKLERERAAANVLHMHIKSQIKLISYIKSA